MKGKINLGILFIILFFGFVSSFEISQLDNMGCDIIKLAENQIIGLELPPEIPFKNEIINIYVSEKILGSVEIVNKKIFGIECEENKGVTYKIYIKDYSTFLEFEKGFDLNKLNSMLGDEIKIEGVGFGKKIKMFFIKSGLKISSWVS
jgi:hypothetical protein